MAILRHELPDGSVHFDLLLADGEAPDEARVVPTWRCPVDPMAMKPGTCVAIEPLPPHRGLYLRLRQPRELDRGRGVVTPLHAGRHVLEGARLWLSTEVVPKRAFHLEAGSLRRERDADQSNAS